MREKFKKFFTGLIILIIIMIIIYMVLGTNFLHIFTSNYMFDVREVKVYGKAYVEGKLHWDLIKNHIIIFIFLFYIILFFIIDFTISKKEETLSRNAIMEIQERINKLIKGETVNSNPLYLGIDNEIFQILEDRDKMYQLNQENIIQQNQSMAFLAHDLKTPLTSIIGYLTLLQDEPDISENNRRKYTSIALDKSKELEKLVQQFFQLARFQMQSNNLNKKEVDFYNLIVQMRETFYPAIAEKELKVHLDMEEKLIILADADLMARGFYNIFKNAISYTPIRGSIWIESFTEGKCHTIVFKNEAPDFSPEHIHYIFDPFFRTDTSRNKEIEGAGLGLSISREIIENHGGDITAQYEDGKLKFNIKLPK